MRYRWCLWMGAAHVSPWCGQVSAKQASMTLTMCLGVCRVQIEDGSVAASNRIWTDKLDQVPPQHASSLRIMCGSTQVKYDVSVEHQLGYWAGLSLLWQQFIECIDQLEQHGKCTKCTIPYSCDDGVLGYYTGSSALPLDTRTFQIRTLKVFYMLHTTCTRSILV